MYKHAKTLADYINQRYVVDPVSGCWNWIRSLDKHGYGQASGYHQKKYKKSRGHQLSFICHKGEIPDGMCVCHTCDNRKCVNPDHLFLGSFLDNNLDCIRKNRNNIIKGSKHKFAKLTEEQIKEIRALKETHTSFDLAAQYGVSFSLICMIWRNEIWRHVED